MLSNDPMTVLIMSGGSIEIGVTVRSARRGHSIDASYGDVPRSAGYRRVIVSVKR